MGDFTFTYEGKTFECLDTGSDYTVIEWKPDMTQADYDVAPILGCCVTVDGRFGRALENKSLSAPLFDIVCAEIISRHLVTGTLPASS